MSWSSWYVKSVGLWAPFGDTMILRLQITLDHPPIHGKRDTAIALIAAMSLAGGLLTIC